MKTTREKVNQIRNKLPFLEEKLNDEEFNLLCQEIAHLQARFNSQCKSRTIEFNARMREVDKKLQYLDAFGNACYELAKLTNKSANEWYVELKGGKNDK